MSGLPEGWREVRIGALCELLNGRAFKPTEWSDRGLPIVRIQNLNDPDAAFNHFSGEVRSRFRIESGDLLFAWSGTPGTSFGAHIWNGGSAVLNQHIFKVVFDETALDKQFFRLAINQKLDELIGKAHGGVGLRHVTKGKFEDTEVVVPPLPVQRRIVAKLDSLFARTKAAREELARVPKLVERYKQAVLEKAFRGELTGAGNEGIRRSRIADLMISTFYGPRISSDAYVSEDGVPTLRTTDIADWGKLNLNKPPHVRVSNQELERWGFEDQDLMITRTGATIGKCALYEQSLGPALPSAYLIRLRLRLDIVDAKYVLLFLLSPSGTAQLLSGRTATAQPNINSTAISEIELPVPPLNEQRKIVRAAEQAFRTIDRAYGEYHRAYDLLDRLDQATLAKAFRGELVSEGRQAVQSV
jgi:type I restriction enzyme S subunit